MVAQKVRMRPFVNRTNYLKREVGFRKIKYMHKEIHFRKLDHRI